MDGGDLFVGEDLAREPFGAFFGLCHQHLEAVHSYDTPFFRFQQKLGPGGVVDDIQNTLQIGKPCKIHGGNTHKRVHTHGGGIDDNGCIGMKVEVTVVVFSCAGDDDHLRAQRFQNGHSGVGCAAAAQNQHLFAGNRQTAVCYHGPEAEKIGVVANETAVASADNGVHCPQLLRHIGQLIQVGDHILFIGHGHIQSCEVTAF